MSEPIGAKVDAYLAAMPDWARGLCLSLRSAILATDDGLVEVWKWNGPCYQRQGLVCGFDAAKTFVSITFFRGGEMVDADQAFNHCVGNQHNRSIRFERDAVINPNLITRYVQEAVQLNLQGPKPQPARPSTELMVPDDLAALLATQPNAKATFEALAPYKRKDYLTWIGEAKRVETRRQRLEKTINNLKAGLGLHDKYRS